jgi:hypothetical protein
MYAITTLPYSPNSYSAARSILSVNGPTLRDPNLDFFSLSQMWLADGCNGHCLNFSTIEVGWQTFPRDCIPMIRLLLLICLLFGQVTITTKPDVIIWSARALSRLTPGGYLVVPCSRTPLWHRMLQGNLKWQLKCVTFPFSMCGGCTSTGSQSDSGQLLSITVRYREAPVVWTGEVRWPS